MRESCLFLLIVWQLSGWTWAGEATPDLVGRAQKLANDQPSFDHHVGLSEVYRAAGRPGDVLNALRAAQPNDPAEMVSLLELTCWRMLPLTPANREAFAREVERLRQVAPANDWLRVHTMLLALHANDRNALLTAAEKPPNPVHFPTAAAEVAHRTMLLKLGVARNRSGLEVIASRTHEPLHALRDLDRGLGREAEFLRTAGKPADADKLQRSRDSLRLSYDRAARTVVEKLFALNLLGRQPERDALLKRAKDHPYLTDRAALTDLFQRTDALVAGVLLIEPLLRSEVEFLHSPPEMGQYVPSTFLPAQVRARRRSEQPGATVYEGEASLTLGVETITCERLVVAQPLGEAALVGSGGVRVVGLPDVEAVEADRFAFNPETGGYTFGGAIKLHVREGRVEKLRACTIMRSGEVRDRRSLLDDFAQALEIEQKLALLPAIMAHYEDGELPDEVRYLLALSLLRPHLSWDAPYLPRRPDDRQRELEQVKRPLSELPDEPWQEALGGEDWMVQDIHPDLRDRVREAVEAFNREAGEKGQRIEMPRWTVFPWRITDSTHPDITRAVALLDAIRGDLAQRAQRWAAEIRRNNTVLTVDVAGGYAAGKPAPIVLDVRNADRVAFRIYRVRKPAELLPILTRVGTDFVYHDHGLQYGEGLQRLIEKIAEVKRLRATRDVSKKEKADPLPNFLPEALVHSWDVNPSELKSVPWRSRWERRDYEEQEYRRDDGDYFDDECREHQARLDREYHPERWAVSTWQVGRIVEVPAKAVPEAGAYVLVAEANGQTTVAPLIVDPLSLTLRRCRDGVVVLVSDADGQQPVTGAEMLATRQRGEAITDAAGVAFARVFAAGDRALVAHKDGRFAVGGFGHVFEGIYHSPWERARRHWMSEEPDKEVAAELREGHVYADRHVVAAYTDRPTYRPGQQVQFKLIVRRLKPDPKPGEVLQGFRAEDFDRAARLELPGPATHVRYAVVDPRGREVASGGLELNDHGTATDSLTLLAEAATGAYSLRVRIAEVDRVVPNTFAVRYYRRPNFELTATGVPAKVKKAERLTVRLEGRYYFGKPVVGGRVELKLLTTDGARPLADAEGQLDADGKASLELNPPAQLTGGRYVVSCTLTDDSDRTVTVRLPLEVEGETLRGVLANLPCFLLADKALSVPSDVEVTAIAADGARHAFKPEKGAVAMRLPLPGWYRLVAGETETVVYVYGGDGPIEHQPPEAWGEWPGWVDLSRYRSEEDGTPDEWRWPGVGVQALFDQRYAEVGGRIRVLIHVPYRKARVLFTLEGYTVLDYRVADLAEGPYAVVELPVTRRHLPNVYVQGFMILGEERLPKREEARDRLERAW